MAKPIRLTPKKTDTGSWRLSIPPKLSGIGRRQQLFYRTQALALAAAADLKEKREEFGSQAKAIGPTLAEQATIAADLLRPWNLSLVEAARIVAAMRERETASMLLGDAADLWLAECAPLRDRTVKNYKLTTDSLRKTLGDRLLATIRAEEIQAILAPAGRPATAVSGQIRNAKAFWRWSAKKGWCIAEVFDGVTMPKTSKDGEEIAILTAAETESILRTAEKYFPQAVATFALQLFAGIRVEEVARMNAGNVTADGIDLPAAVTKKGRRRHITPNATLAAWLAKYPFAPCPNWRETSAAVRRLCGWDVVSAILNERVRVGTMKALPKLTRGRWPQNALRHSHASYAVASGTALETLLFEFGHSGTTNVLREHYVGRASKKQALAFFAIAPAGVELPQKLEVVA